MSHLSFLRRDLACGLGLLTRLPCQWIAAPQQEIQEETSADTPEALWTLGRSVWCWPPVGAAIGASGGGLYAVLLMAGLTPILAASWATGALLLLTGALHEDGLADMADGCGGGRDRARKLAIMRDSRIGSFGALALGLMLVVRIAAMARFAPGSAVMALTISGALSRAALVLVPTILPPARPDGLARQLAALRAVPVTIALGSALAAAFLLSRPPAAITACLAGLLATGLVAMIARRQLGGHTGDVLGAAACVTDCACLSALGALAP